jgi:hypothetical protein
MQKKVDEINQGEFEIWSKTYLGEKFARKKFSKIK